MSERDWAARQKLTKAEKERDTLKSQLERALAQEDEYRRLYERREAQVQRLQEEMKTSTDIVLRPSVLAFAQDMERRLRQNEWKGGWGKENYMYFLDMIDKEREELEQAATRFYTRPDSTILSKRMLHEAADLANFAMMLADQVRAKT